MKIEVGESLIYSYLRHEKNCLVTQINWKPSSSWEISADVLEMVNYEFDKIKKHHAFSDIFKSEFQQTLKQTEIDVLGIDSNNHIYAFEIAFHENGLQYGGKIETRNRVFKKLLRAYLALKYYFPGFTYCLAFCSPKVNPATGKHIQDYFEVLWNDFQTDDITFHYFCNDSFNKDIAQKTLSKIGSEADSSELFARSVKLFKMMEISIPKPDPLPPPEGKSDPDPGADVDNEFVIIKGLKIPLSKNESESVQDYVKKVMRLLLNENVLSKEQLEQLQDKDFCKNTFSLQFPLIRKVNEGYKDHTGRGRYWSKEVFGGQFYVCSQWWKAHHPTYLIKLKEFLRSLKDT